MSGTPLENLQLPPEIEARLQRLPTLVDEVLRDPGAARKVEARVRELEREYRLEHNMTRRRV